MVSATTVNVTVAVRVRPLLHRDEGQRQVVRCIQGKETENPTVMLDVLTSQLATSPRYEQKFFAFDHCFDTNARQEEIFDKIGKKIVENTLEGYNTCIFAYGQTGSGKSYSIIGPEDDEGLIPRVTRELPWASGNTGCEFGGEGGAGGGLGRDTNVVTGLNSCSGGAALGSNNRKSGPPGPVISAGGTDSSNSGEFRVTVSFLEIYNEQLRDLLNPAMRKKPLYVHQHPKLGIYVPHLTEAPVVSHQECMSRLDFGNKIRATAQTNMNAQSSRSHSLFIVRITRTVEKVIYSATINLIDLAGSERVKKAGHHGRGTRINESANINSSLSVLGIVISKLASERKFAHVPFRQSKLTYLLQDALSGNSRTWMMANVSPAQSETEETLSTLRFAQSVKKVKLTAFPQQQDEAETDLMLQTMMTELNLLKKTELNYKAVEGPQVTERVRLRREVEAMENQMERMQSQFGGGWDSAKQREKEQELLRQELLHNLRVGRMRGMACGHPYILNISADVALTGRLLYELDKDTMSVGSDMNNDIPLQGLGISKILCVVKKVPCAPAVSSNQQPDPSKGQQPNFRLVVVKEPQGGRLCVNGEDIEREVVLQHGDRLVFGRAFAFRLVMPGMPNLPEDGNVDQMNNPGLNPPLQSMPMDSVQIMQQQMQQQLQTPLQMQPQTEEEDKNLKSALSIHRELQRRGLSEERQSKFLERLNRIQSNVEESNELIQELLGSRGPKLSVCFMNSLQCIAGQTQEEPEIVIEQREYPQGGDEDQPLTLVAVWLESAFMSRLDVMRDLYQQHLENVLHGDGESSSKNISNKLNKVVTDAVVNEDSNEELLSEKDEELLGGDVTSDTRDASSNRDIVSQFPDGVSQPRDENVPSVPKGWEKLGGGETLEKLDPAAETAADIAAQSGGASGGGQSDERGSAHSAEKSAGGTSAFRASELSSDDPRNDPNSLYDAPTFNKANRNMNSSGNGNADGEGDDSGSNILVANGNANEEEYSNNIAVVASDPLNAQVRCKLPTVEAEVEMNQHYMNSEYVDDEEEVRTAFGLPIIE